MRSEHRQIARLMLAVLATCGEAHADRLKELAVVRGTRANSMLGYGLVVGLQGTGDDITTSVTTQSIISMLRKLNVRVDSGQLIVRNTAAVMVTASLPPFARSGNRFDITVSSLGTAKSLQGGTLLPTPLQGADFKVYAMAQGEISVGGFAAGGASGGGVKKGHTTVGRVPNGAIVEREIPVELGQNGEISVALIDPDFTTATRVAQAISEKLGKDTARTRDPGTVVVKLPKGRNLVEIVAELEAIEVTADRIARVVINERTGTIVVGDGVRLEPVAVAHGGLTVEVKETLIPSQPAPLSSGKTTVVPETEVTVKESEAHILQLARAATLGDVVKALNAFGVTPRDLVSILQALKSVGALRSELVIQ